VCDSVVYDSAVNLFLPSREGDPGAQTAPITVNVNPPSILAGTTTDVDVTVPGAAVGMGVVCQSPALAADLLIGMVRVKAADTVTVRLRNTSTLSAVDSPAADWLFWLARA
jgi:hypothetical protein